MWCTLINSTVQACLECQPKQPGEDPADWAQPRGAALRLCRGSAVRHPDCTRCGALRKKCSGDLARSGLSAGSAWSRGLRDFGSRANRPPLEDDAKLRSRWSVVAGSGWQRKADKLDLNRGVLVKADTLSVCAARPVHNERQQAPRRTSKTYSFFSWSAPPPPNPTVIA